MYALYGSELQHGMAAWRVDRSRITLASRDFYASDRSRCEKAVNVAPIVGWAIGESERYLGAATDVRADAAALTQLARGSLVSRSKRIVESPDAPEARRQCDICDRQVGIIQQALRKVQTTGLTDRRR